MMEESTTFDKKFWKYFGWFIGIVVLICFFPWIFTSLSIVDFTKTGQIGDTIGGIIGPYVAIAAAGLTFIAFWVQYKANIQQRHDIAIERFESNLFEMIHIQQEIVNILNAKMLDLFHNIVSVSGRDVFQFVYEQMYFNLSVGVESLKENLDFDDELKTKLNEVNELWFLDHYYRHLYRIFKVIDEASVIDSNKKYEYAAIVRATLSPYELVMLYYNGFSQPKFKNLIEKYAILNNIRPYLLASKNDKELIKNKFQSNYPYSKDENREMRLEYKKGAFVYKK